MISIRFNDYLNLVEDLFFEKKIKRGEKIRAIFVLRKQSLIDSNQTVLYRFSSLFGIFIFEIFFLFVPPSIFAIIVYKILNYAILISLFFCVRLLFNHIDFFRFTHISITSIDQFDWSVWVIFFFSPIIMMIFGWPIPIGKIAWD